MNNKAAAHKLQSTRMEHTQFDAQFDMQSHFINALRTQKSHKPEGLLSGPLHCPYGHNGRIFQNFDQLLDHIRLEHVTKIHGLSEKQERLEVREAVVRARQSGQLQEGIEGGNVTPDLASLSLEPGKERQTSPSGKKRRADSDIRAQQKRGTSAGDNVVIADPDYSRDIAYTMGPEQPRSKPQDNRLYNHKKATRGTALPRRQTKEQSRDRSDDKGMQTRSSTSPNVQSQNSSLQPIPGHPRQAGLLELQKHDPRYPGLLLQPESRPISQEQLASEVKSIYAGLTMVETKCITVDKAQAATPGKRLAPEHWQALIALHRTLLHEHHDFFLASQHPSASPALRRLAGKYTMPARMWQHGIHPFLELLRLGLPHTLDYMLAFIYLAYQMMALLYETVPAFEDTWIECLGDLGRYRMAIEDEDIRDRETWANVAKSWYYKAADRNPTVGRLSHHLAILARSNALQQLYYYTASLSSVEPFKPARESIMNLFGPLLPKKEGQTVAYIPDQPVDTNFVKAHALLFTKFAKAGYEQVSQDFMAGLDIQIGRVTAKWREQGVYIAVSNLTAWFDYGVDLNIIRQIFLLRAAQRKSVEAASGQLPSTNDQKPKPTDPSITEDQIQPQLDGLSNDPAFFQARRLTYDTLALALRRVGDKNVLPHVHVMLSFLSTLASIPYVSHLVNQIPWAELVAFLNALIKTERQMDPNVSINDLLSQPLFPGDETDEDRDEQPLPEDYLVRGLVWVQEYLPPNWLRRELEEEDRYLELASTAKNRTERVLRLGHRLSKAGRWISYDQTAQTFAVFSV